MSENILSEDEIDIKMDPDEIPDTDQAPNKMDADQDHNIIDTEMDIKQFPNIMDAEQVPDKIDTEHVADDPPPSQEIIEELSDDEEAQDNPPDLTNENFTTYAEVYQYENFVKKQNDKIEAKENDAMERLRIVSNMLDRCRQMSKGDFQEVPVPLIQRLTFFTKANPDYLAEVLQGYKPRNRSVKQAVLDTQPIPPHIDSLIYNDIRDVFVEFYLEKMQIPTKISLLESLLDRGSKKTKTYYKNIKLRTLVKNNLVIYHDIPKLNRYILIENPEFAYRRNKYLRQVNNYRMCGAKFIYVTAMSVDTDMGAMTFTLAASSTTGLIDKLKPVLSTAVGFSSTIKHWLAELLPSLDPSAIIVLTQPRKKNGTPTLYSTKDEMFKWLIKRDIPTELDIHKCHLYKLVKLTKDNKDTGFYDDVFTNAGFKVVVNPYEYKSLDYFNPIYRECTSNESEFNEAERMEEFMKNMSQEDWKKLEQVIVEEEKKMMKEDREMETIIENLFELIKNGDVEEDDFPEGCKGDRSDNFDVHIGDIIID